MALLELGLVDGMAFSSSSVDAIEAAINQCSPAGTVAMYIGTVAPTGWLFLAGQVVVNAQTLYPDLWAVAPAGWKSGASLTLPNMANTFVCGPGATALDTVGGANTVAIDQANLPASGIEINPPNKVVSINPPNKVVSINPPNAGVTINDPGHFHADLDHYHASLLPAATSGSIIVPTAPVPQGGVTDPKTTGITASVDIAPFDVNVDIDAFDVNVDIDLFTSGPLGAGTALPLPAPPHLALNFIIKVH